MDAALLNKLFGSQSAWQGPCTVVVDAAASVVPIGPDSFGSSANKQYAPRVTSGRIAADAAAGVLAQVLLDPLPVVAVAADLLAPGAHRQHAAQLLDLRQRLLQLPDALGQLPLQVERPLGDAEAGGQLGVVERLGQVVVG